MGSGDDDLDWLYGRDRRPVPPEETQVVPEAPSRPNYARPVPAATLQQPPPPPPRTVSPAPPPPPGSPAAVRVGGRKRHPVRAVLLLLGALLLLVVGALVAVPAYAWSHVHRVDESPSGARPVDQPGTTFLLVGSDSRAGLTKAERHNLGTGSAAGQRTDTVMLMYIPPSGKPALISIPRDSYVPIPQHGTNKINAAFAFGGPKLLVQTVEHNTGLRVDAYLEVGFGGFVNVIDSVGGIQMCLPKAIQDRDSHLNLPKGCQNLDGAKALGYVRMRHADPRGDLGRVERQRAMLAAVAKKSLSAGTLANPTRYWHLSNATADSLQLGRHTSFRQMVSLALAMRKVSSGQGMTLTVPVANPNARTAAGLAVLWNDRQAKQMFGDIARGDTSGLSKYAK